MGLTIRPIEVTESEYFATANSTLFCNTSTTRMYKETCYKLSLLTRILLNDTERLLYRILYIAQMLQCLLLQDANVHRKSGTALSDSYRFHA